MEEFTICSLFISFKKLSMLFFQAQTLDNEAASQFFALTKRGWQIPELLETLQMEATTLNALQFECLWKATPESQEFLMAKTHPNQKFPKHFVHMQTSTCLTKLVFFFRSLGVPVHDTLRATTELRTKCSLASFLTVTTIGKTKNNFTHV